MINDGTRANQVVNVRPSPCNGAMFDKLLSPRVLLHLEGALLLAAAASGYALSGRAWTWFAIFVLAPDLSMAGYAIGARAGAACYNAAHSTVGPLAAGLLAWWLAPAWIFAALIWLAHVGLDRMLGYGLKYPTAFRDTHFARV